MRRQSRFILSVLAFGYAFLYIPLVSVIIYSFNDSKLATVWAECFSKIRNDVVVVIQNRDVKGYG